MKTFFGLGILGPLLGRIILALEEGGGGWVGYVLNGGPFAIVVFLLVTDRLTTPGERDRLRAELTAAHLREASLNESIRNDFMPLMIRSIEATTRNREITERVLQVLSDDKRFPGVGDGK